MQLKKSIYIIDKIGKQKIINYCKLNKTNLTEMAHVCEIKYIYFYFMVMGKRPLTPKLIDALKTKYGIEL